jgi:hypothetical protein
MSLYNAICGVNLFAFPLLEILWTDMQSVPRFRDCYVDEDGHIVILTKTGGERRASYENPEAWQANADNLTLWDKPACEGPWNEDLRKIPGFIEDKDDGYDSNFAYFYYSSPEDMTDIVAEIKEKQGTYDPLGTFRQVLADLQARKDTPATRKAMEVGKNLFGQIEAAVSQDDHPGIIEI